MTTHTKQEFADNARKSFQGQVMDEEILIMYRLLSSAIIGLQCNKIQITPSHYIALQGDKIISKLDVSKPPLIGPSFQNAFREIYKRDDLIRRYILIETDNSDIISCTIVRNMGIE